MHRLRYAKLAACAAALALFAAGPLKQPLKVRFQLTDGVRLSGEMTAWDAEGFDGTFGRRKWIELKVDDAWKLYQRLMDQESWKEWVDLGRVMLLNAHVDQKAGALAERAFARAIQLNEGAKDAIQSARDEALAAERKRREAQNEAKAARLRTISPEGESWRPDPWPVLTEQEQKSAVLAMRAEAQRIVEKASAPMTAIESDHFILHSDAPREQMARWSILLEKEVSLLKRILQAPADQATGSGKRRAVIFEPWGKIVVIVYTDQDRFRLVEAEAFNQLVPLSTVGICHPIGPKVFINLRLVDDEQEFQWTLMREAAHGLMHRYRTPARPPAWANEGFAELVASLMLPESKFGEARRRQALQFFRRAGDLGAVLGWSYADQTWPGTDGVGAPIGGLISELLMKEKPQQYVEWINAMKDGKPWEESLKRELGVTRESLIDTSVRYSKVND
jgi:hypothetical protein